MTAGNYATITDQVTDRLRRGMIDGTWKASLPGRKRLIEELGCSQWVLEQAAKRLTEEGLLVSRGAGSRHLIALPAQTTQHRALKVVILLYEESDRWGFHVMDLMHRLRENGHDAVCAAKTMHDQDMDVKKIARYVERTDADAWVVLAGSRDVLQWFAGRETPAFALFGRNRQTPLASFSPMKEAAMIELVDRLAGLGHRRIVMLTREERRKPSPGSLERVFLGRLRQRRIPTGSYNLPDWGDSPVDLRKILGSLFTHTPPTALIIDQPTLCVAVIQHLSRLGISVPADVSLACTDPSEAFEWCDPSITHINWDVHSVSNKVVRWANNVSRGKNTRRKNTTKANLSLGGTIGPAPKR